MVLTFKNLIRSKYIKGLILVLVIFLILISPGFARFVLFRGNGIWNPSQYYQRYRADEYDRDKPFFQWWYFSLKDYEENRTFAITYHYTIPAYNQSYRGAYIIFALVDLSQKVRFHIYYRFPLEEMDVSDTYSLNIHGNDFILNPLSDDVYSLKGTMMNASQVWVSHGCSEDTLIQWDLSVERIVGWYGQNDIEPTTKYTGTISWNTYAYDSLVNGTIIINGTKYEITRSPRYRMYCDMNWGENFPDGDPPIQYPWGWFYTGVPSQDPQKDFSIIAGVGRQQTRFLIKNNPMYAKFLSAYLSGTRIAAREGKVFDVKYDRGLKSINTFTSDRLLYFSVIKFDWQNISDCFGVALIPLGQAVIIESVHMKIVMNFTSKEENYNRLLFPTDGFCFSDFEALGVTCKTEIYEKIYDSKDCFHLNPTYQLVASYIDYNAGLEYGYHLGVYP